MNFLRQLICRIKTMEVKKNQTEYGIVKELEPDSEENNIFSCLRECK